MTNWRLDSLIVAVALVAGLIASEFGYRAVLFVRENYGDPALDIGEIYRTPIWTFDPANGFNYSRNGATDHAIFSGGLPALCLSYVSDRNGNPGRDNQVADPARRILVFGDSHTYYPQGSQGDTTWPHLLQDILSARGGRVEVVNYARDGIGILQMLDVAADKIGRVKADLMVIAFISEDMKRARFWRVSKRDPRGRAEVFSSLDGDEDLRPGRHVPTTFLDARADRAWCERLKASGDLNDPLLQDIRKRHREMAATESFGVQVDIATVRTSYLWNRIVRHDPYASTRFRDLMEINYNDFTDDAGFNQAVRRLKESGVHVVLVHLPVFEELVEGRHQMDRQDRSLFESLVRASGFPVIDLLPDRPMDARDARLLFMLPADAHPSLAGLEFYARALAEKLKP